MSMKDRFINLAKPLRTLQNCAGLLATGFVFTAITHTSRADIVYAQDFADGDGDYEETDDDGNSPIPFEYGGGTWSLEGDESGPTNYWLTSPEIAVANTAGLQVSFGHRYSIEAEWDGLALEVSINGSDFQQVPGSSFSQNGYDFEGLIGNHSLNGGEGFNGESEGYFDDELVTSIASVGGVGAGGTIRVRFLGAFDEGARGEGIPNWEIASVSIDTLDDEDGDGMPDSYEEANGLDSAVDDASGDLDEDTVSNVTEYLARTNPQSKDTDSDGLNDNVETNTGEWVSATDTGTNPLSDDSDDDTLTDTVETNTGIFVSATNTGTNPLLSDTDGDGTSDSKEIADGTDPLDPNSVPSFPIPIGYWPLDDGEGTEIMNVVNPDLAGTLNGAAWTSDGHSGSAGDSAIDVEGVTESFVEVPPMGVTFEEATITGWVKGVATGPWTGLIQARGAANIPLGMGVRDSSGELTYTWNNNSAATYSFVSELAIPEDEWAFIALVVTPEDATLYVGANGELNMAVNEISHVEQTNDEISWFFGKDNCCGTERNWDGSMDDIAIWDVALTATGIQELFDGTRSPVGAISSIPFQITELERNPATNEVTVTWDSSPSGSYSVLWAENLEEEFNELEDGVEGQEGSTSFVDTVPAGTKVRYYKIVEQ
ncbi:MAG: hypothetical protein ACI9R3_005380 [Verrucomicrobiales bacterium]|jgi:hypothetical protein